MAVAASVAILTRQWWGQIFWQELALRSDRGYHIPDSSGVSLHLWWGNLFYGSTSSCHHIGASDGDIASFLRELALRQQPSLPSCCRLRAPACICSEKRQQHQAPPYWCWGLVGQFCSEGTCFTALALAVAMLAIRGVAHVCCEETCFIAATALLLVMAVRLHPSWGNLLYT